MTEWMMARQYTISKLEKQLNYNQDAYDWNINTVMYFNVAKKEPVNIEAT